MKTELSILIPIYNACCTPLVEQLYHQAKSLRGLRFEIIVADDGSDREDTIAANKPINMLECCSYVLRDVNSGRAAIRNFLAGEARYEWLLFIDGDMSVVRNEFLADYLRCEDADVVCGGYKVGKGEKSNLRYRYEKDAEPRLMARERRKRPYHDFHTSNFMIRRDLMLDHPFDEQFRRYGYEDVFFGKELRRADIRIAHIDNPVCFDTFEDNPHFVEKTEEGLQTLYEFRYKLRGYNGLLTFVGGIHIGLVRSTIRLWHRLFGSLERRWLCGRHPNLTIFKLYKLGYYLTLTLTKDN